MGSRGQPRAERFAGASQGRPAQTTVSHNPRQDTSVPGVESQCSERRGWKASWRRRHLSWVLKDTWIWRGGGTGPQEMDKDRNRGRERGRQRESWEARSESFSGPDYRGLAPNPQYPKPVGGSRTLRRLDVCSPCVLPSWGSPSPVLACKRPGSFT